MVKEFILEFRLQNTIIILNFISQSYLPIA